MRQYFEAKSLCLFFLGASSSVPLVLTASTLSLWLSIFGVSKSAIGLFALTSLPYSIKFIWGPIFDATPAPFFKRFFKHRASWIILSQIMIIFGIILISFGNPSQSLFYIAISAIFLTFFSSWQDIAIDSKRIDIFQGDKKGVGASMYIFGYRLGMLIAGPGVIYVTKFSEENWQIGYLSTIIIMLAGIIATIQINKTPEQVIEKPEQISFLQKIVIPFKDFCTTHQLWYIILVFILLYKLGDAFLGTMTQTYLVDIGYSKEQIANISKIVGLIATLIGTFLGGLMMQKLSLTKCLLISIILQSISNLAFLYQQIVPISNFTLSIITFAENFTSGIGGIVIISYLSSLCNLKFSATQYAILSSVAVSARTIISSSSGFIVETIGWSNFFIFSAIIGLPPLLILKYIKKA